MEPGLSSIGIRENAGRDHPVGTRAERKITTVRVTLK